MGKGVNPAHFILAKRSRFDKIGVLLYNGFYAFEERNENNEKNQIAYYFTSHFNNISEHGTLRTENTRIQGRKRTLLF